ncbi:MAG: HAD hydrolase-like protein [Candidatus Zapsychrus exili]|nr:HAD hydrolase-like protein [Candidatus Zapsychrus exili]
MKIKSYIFDMDGVITNTMPDHYKCWHDIFLQEGIRTTHAEVYLREGQKGIDSVLEIFAEHNKLLQNKKQKRF